MGYTSYILSTAFRHKALSFIQKERRLKLQRRKHITAVRVKKSKHGAWQCLETLVPVENFDHFGGSLGTVHDLLRNYDRRDLCSAPLDKWNGSRIEEDSEFWLVP